MQLQDVLSRHTHLRPQAFRHPHSGPCLHCFSSAQGILQLLVYRYESRKANKFSLDSTVQHASSQCRG